MRSETTGQSPIEMDSQRPADEISPPGLLRTIAIFLALAGCLLGVTYLLGEAVTSEWASPVRSGFDRPVLEWFESLRSSSLTDLARVVTDLGGTLVIMIVLVGGAIVSYLLFRDPRWPIFFGAVLITSPQLSSLSKVLVDRARPTLSPLYEFALITPAFPSGHATNSAATYCAVALLLAALTRKVVLVWVVVIAVVLAVGLTRIYLGVHWPTDVLAGWLLGAGSVAACAWAVRPPNSRKEPPGETGILRA